MELFEEQSAEYQRSVFPVGAPVMSIEPASTNAWKRYAHAPYGTVLLRVAIVSVLVSLNLPISVACGVCGDCWLLCMIVYLFECLLLPTSL
jgi:hypothetical protein